MLRLSPPPLEILVDFKLKITSDKGENRVASNNWQTRSRLLVVGILALAISATGLASPDVASSQGTKPLVPAAKSGENDKEGAEIFRAWVRYFHPLDGDKRIPNLRAGVFFNDALGALKFALAEKKPLILIMVNRYSLASARLISSALPCPSVERFAQYAVFAVTEPGDMATYDVSGKVIADALQVRGYPTISIIEPNPDKLIERHRIEGLFPGDTIGESLEKALVKETRGKLLSVAEAERQFRDSGLGYKGHPIGTCGKSPFSDSAKNSYVSPSQLKKNLEDLKK
jgi:hypothetical protein